MPSLTATRIRICCLCRQRKDLWECDYNDRLQAYVCDECTTKHGYDSVNETWLGRPSKTSPPFSLEFEVATPFYYAWKLDRALLLIKYGYQRTYDETVDDEYKSPIYRNLRSFYRPLEVLHSLRDLVSEACGTHLHVSFRHKPLLEPIQDIVFAPLLAHLQANREQTIAFWGRTLCEFACAPSKTRRACFNLQSVHDTLEYRLPRFRDAAQYLSVVRFCLKTTAYLDACLDRPALVSPQLMAQRIMRTYYQAVQCAGRTDRLPTRLKGLLSCAD